MKVSLRFEDNRVGRNHDVAPTLLILDDPDELAIRVHRFVRPMLASRGIDVIPSDADKPGVWTGTVFAGIHVAARYIAEEVKP